MSLVGLMIAVKFVILLQYDARDLNGLATVAAENTAKLFGGCSGWHEENSLYGFSASGVKHTGVRQ
jgi:hypothetical protein